MDEYKNMLDRAHNALPEKTHKFERFEVPAIQSFFQGNKTIIKNFDLIVQKTRRKPQTLAKYFSHELAVPVTVQGSKLVLNGKFYERNLKDKLQQFVDSAVICRECKRPDTKIVDQAGVKMLVCEACGARSPLKL